MSFYSALFAWLVLSAVLVLGVVMAAKGVFWLLIVSLLVFFAAFSKWGCASH